MEIVVEELQNPCGNQPPNISQVDEAPMEPGMHVPSSIFNECCDLLKAADEQHVKASMKLLADTGLMGLLCCHDHVLWVVNMSSLGECQHYVLALLHQLLNHLLKSINIGLLYDIACQLHHSCVKWDFLGEDLAHVDFSNHCLLCFCS
jgi:hypothetical protein